MSEFKISDSEYNEIEKAIGSDESVVGIDAKKTHIIIIQLLKEIQDSIQDLDERIDKIEKQLPQSS